MSAVNTSKFIMTAKNTTAGNALSTLMPRIYFIGITLPITIRTCLSMAKSTIAKLETALIKHLFWMLLHLILFISTISVTCFLHTGHPAKSTIMRKSTSAKHVIIVLHTQYFLQDMKQFTANH